MNLTTLAKRSLSFFWRSHLAVMGGVAVTAAVLSGSLAVGDSVKESLAQLAKERIAGVRWAVVGNDRFFTDGLAKKLGESLEATSAGVVQLVGSVANANGSTRANGVQVLGVDGVFWKLGGAEVDGGEDFLGVNEALARRLGLEVGDTLVTRVEIPGALSRDAPLSGTTDETVSVRKKVTHILPGSAMGEYSLHNEQSSPLNLYLNRVALQSLLGKEGKVNVALVGEASDGEGRALENWEVADALAEGWELADASLELRKIHGGRKWALRSERIFIDRSIAKAVRDFVSPSDGVLTYLVNGIEHGDKLTPYSMVSAVETNTHSLFPAGLPEDGIVVGEWLAEDLGIASGDQVRLRYYIALNGRELREEESVMKVTGVLPMSNSELNVEWTPDFPGVSDAEDNRDWEPGMPVDLDLIRDKDEDYWDNYKGTPKAFIGLHAGQQLWANRFGELTGVQFLTGRLDEASFVEELRKRIGPGDFGLHLRDVGAEASASVGQSMDFGALFASMSFFLIVAALILTGLLFAFGVEQRSEQIGLCLAVGFGKGQVRRWFLMEALVVSVAGAVIGTVVGVIYTRLALWALGGIWADAVAGMQFVYHASSVSLMSAAAGSVLLSMVAVYFASRILMRIEPRALITGSYGIEMRRRRPLVKCVSFWLGLGALLGGLGGVMAPGETSEAKQEAFFSAGMLLLVAGICGCVLLWRAMEQRGGSWKGNLWALGRSYALGRRGRSLAIVAVMASGVFMVTAMNSMRLNAQADAERRTSGTGGYRYFAESTLPIYENLNTATGREEYGLGEVEVFSILQIRVSNGDDASCLNLNRAQKPQLLGLDPMALAERGSFDFVKTIEGVDERSPWELLADGEDDEGAVPGLIDLNTAIYALGMKLGDVVAYEDGRGGSFKVRLAGFVANSVLQGNVLISEKVFIEKFPDAGGFKIFLLDAPSAAEGEKTIKTLSRMLEDRGFAAMPAWERLAEFNAVQNTYLSIFSTLGGLGVLLGTVGLAVLVGRNVLERKGQLGLMRAMGFTVRDLARLVLAEHWFLHVLGVLLGLATALVAVSGLLTQRGGELPVVLLLGVVGGILAAGLFFCWWAARLVLRFPLMDAIRDE